MSATTLPPIPVDNPKRRIGLLAPNERTVMGLQLLAALLAAGLLLIAAAWRILEFDPTVADIGDGLAALLVIGPVLASAWQSLMRPSLHGMTDLLIGLAVVAAWASLDGGTVVAAKVRDGLEVRREASGEPDHFEVALGLTFQSAAGGHAVEVAVDVKLQQRGWIVAGSAGVGRPGTVKTQLGEVQVIHERVDHAHGIVLVHVVVHALGQQQRLAPVPTLNVARHDALTPERFRAVIVPGLEAFGYWLG